MAHWDTRDPFAAACDKRGVLNATVDGEHIPLLLGYHDIRKAADDVRQFSSNAPFRVPIPAETDVRSVRQLPIETDPPEHTDYRALLKPMFSVGRRAEMAPRIDALVRSMLDAVVGAGDVEMVSAFALPLQSRALAVLLKLPDADADEWIRWGRHVFRGAQGQCAEKGGVLERYLHRRLEQATAQTEGDDFFHMLTRATIHGRPLRRDEQLGFANLVFAGGRDTVISAVSLAMAHLATHPQDRQRLRATPRLINTAVEEMVRIATPLSVIGRVCPVGASVHGVDVSAGARVGLCWASANRDPVVFEAPEHLKIDRKQNPHLGFGWGPHACLGAAHTRLLLRTLIRLVCETVGTMTRRDSTPLLESWEGLSRQVGYEALHVQLGA